MKLPTETAKRRNGIGYAVAPEMFHQLHCLVCKVLAPPPSHLRAIESENLRGWQDHGPIVTVHLRKA